MIVMITDHSESLYFTELAVMLTDWLDQEARELVDGDDLPWAEKAQAGGALDWLADEPDRYGGSDLPVFVTPTR